MINTPDEGAIKWWIGNAAEDGKAATVFARLKVPASDGELTLKAWGPHVAQLSLHDLSTPSCVLPIYLTTGLQLQCLVSLTTCTHVTST